MPKPSSQQHSDLRSPIVQGLVSPQATPVSECRAFSTWRGTNCQGAATNFACLPEGSARGQTDAAYPRYQTSRHAPAPMLGNTAGASTCASRCFWPWPRNSATKLGWSEMRPLVRGPKKKPFLAFSNLIKFANWRHGQFWRRVGKRSGKKEKPT